MRRNEVARLRRSVMSARTRPMDFAWQDVGPTGEPFIASYLGWQDAYVGVGHSYASATLDVTRQIVRDGWDARQVFRCHVRQAVRTRTNAHAECGHNRHQNDDCHVRWFIFLRLRAA